MATPDKINTTPVWYLSSGSIGKYYLKETTTDYHSGFDPACAFVERERERERERDRERERKREIEREREREREREVGLVPGRGSSVPIPL